MNNLIYAQSNRWGRLLLIVAVLLGGSFSLVPPAKAQQIVFQDTIPAGQTLENDAILAGTDISVAGNVVGDVLAVGTNVNISGGVDGSLIALGQNVSIAGPVSGTTFVLSLELILDSTADLARNLYFGGLSLTTKEGSTIERDLNAVSLGANLNGSVGRTTNAIIGPLEVFRAGVNLFGLQDKLPLGQGLRLPTQPAARSLQEQVRYSGLVPPLRWSASGELQQTQVDTAQLQAWFLGVLRNLITLLVFGLIAIWLFPRQLHQAARLTRRKPWQATGIGLLALVIAFALILVVGLLFTLILAVGIWLASVHLSGLAFAVWMVGFSTLALVFSLSALFVAYGTKVLVAFLVGLLLLEWIFPRAAQQRFWPLLVGLVLYVLLASIPGLGWVIAVLVTAIGLGSAWQLYRQHGEPPAVPEPAEYVEEITV